jgi:hypothetical protein
MVTLAEQIRCVEREIRMRNRVYPGLVDRRKLDPRECERELLHMGAVLETLKHCEQLAKCFEEAQRVPSGPAGAFPAGHELAAGHIEISDGLARKVAAQLRGGEA